MTQEKNDKQKQLEEAEARVNYYTQLINTPKKSVAIQAINEGMDLLRAQRAINLDTIKDSCKSELQRFIDLRGSINKKTGTVHLPLMSVSASNQAATIKTIQAASALISKIERVDSFVALSELLDQESTNMSPDFTALIGRCMMITQLPTEDRELNTPK
jgi:hypothetical protein